MELRHILFKGIDLDNENKFMVNLTEINSIEKIKFSLRRSNFVTNLEENAKIETNIMKWNYYDKIHRLSQFCHALNKSDKEDQIMRDLILIRKEVDKLEHDFIFRKYYAT